MPKPIVMIAVPTYETITPDTFKALWDMGGKNDYLCAFEFVRGYDCAAARNNIAKRALEIGADYVMMVDSDVTVPCDALINLISHDVDVCSGYYMHRDSSTNAVTECTCICKLLKPDGSHYFGYPLESEYTAQELRELRENGVNLIEIHGGGMGCILIKTSVFEEVPYPWFDWVDYGKGIGMLSEDLFFCESCRNEGIKIYADTRVACGHMMRRIEYVN